MDKLRQDIAGEITLSAKPGATMKKWREVFQITQAELAEHLGISASTISDYEGNRRQSPGTGIVRRFIDALLEIDSRKGGAVTQKLTEHKTDTYDEYFYIHEFATSIPALDFTQLIEGKAVANEDLLASKKLYGYTLMDSLKIILQMPFNQFPRLYGTMSERAFVFTQVSTGRSPMVVIRVTPMKPSLVVLHGIKKVDEIALKIAEREQIPVMTTNMELEKMKKALDKI